MRRKLFTLVAILTGSFTAADAEVESDFHQPDVIQKIAFGSCSNPRKGKTPMFDAVRKHKPDAFIFLGDNIYGDTEDMELLQKKWMELGDVEGFRKLRGNTTVIATWDDHDYGVNDGGKSYKKREESQRIFLDFFKDPADSPRRKRAGVYGSYTFGTPGKMCQILLLDTRYFRDELPRAKGPKAKGTVGWYVPTDDTSKTLLGEAQWKWLDEQLQVPADIRIIGSSIQVLAHEKGMENWGNVPHQRKRLFELLKKHKADHTFAISGDVHFAELSKMDFEGYPFFDLTSSGMTNTSKSWAAAKNSFRVDESHPVQNAGLIEIDWADKSLELSIINKDGEKVLHHPLKFSELEFK
ncbi:MAG: alkaline phosphatase family protein [Luteolibacter sp.]|jgi:alkaline phosphatase D|tara:strand:- start:5558 stop:6616 length:1059 start_codon:yes stop_codon:yes gene_type:complete